MRSVEVMKKKKLHSERSDECILILQCCVFFFFMSVNTRPCRNNASISNFGMVSDGKLNLFLTKSIFLHSCNSKTNHCKYLKFSSNCIYIQPLNFSVDKKILDDQKMLKI
ncbi:Uncharacterized protein FWK35_00026901 [Aphis craccivora]|uniref:Uncharacterized protein n=1 Tax=Aphis craccivora TaxID=307492 RepID=A0A6G0XFT6_APHCR|nr:Uncharacterized protein FWK35_00026901 [Aphis craccivora]